jgi:hypothetical protein
MKKSTIYLLAVPVLLAVGASSAQAQTPRTISFQGVLLTPAGTPVPDGNHSLTLTIYDRATGGTTLYTETQTVQSLRGIFNVIIGAGGAGTGIPKTVKFDILYYLGVSVDGGPEVSPRTEMTAVPYAIRAEVADSARAALQAVTADKAMLADTADVLRGGAVLSLNGQKGDVKITGTGGTSVTRVGNDITISSPVGGITEVVNFDNSVGIVNGTGPIAVLSVNEGGITTDKLSDWAVTTPKIMPGAVTHDKLSDNSVSSENIIDGQVKTVDIADGAVTNAKLAPLSITTDKIADGAVTNPKLGPNAVTSDKILDGTIVTADLADNSVTSPKIKDGEVMTVDIADLNVTTGKLADGSVTNPKLAPNAVTTDKILDGTVATADLADGSVTLAKHADNSVNSAKIIDGSIATVDVAPNAITAAKVSTEGAPNGTALMSTGATTPVWGNPFPGGPA